MPFDGIVTSSIVCDLNEKLAGGKIEKIYQPESDEIILHIHAGKSNYKLLISSSSSHARTYLTAAPKANPQNPAAFCMLLRKHLLNGRLISISQKDSERIIEIDIEAQNEMGFSVNKKLIIEIMGKHSNIILIDKATNRIIDSIKRISLDVNRYRQVLPGLSYIYPPDQGKTSCFRLNRDIFLSFFHPVGQSPAISESYCSDPLSNLDTTNSFDRDASAKILMSRIQGISPALSLDLCHQSESLNELYEILSDHIDSIRKCDFSPCVYLGDTGEPVDFHCFRLEEAARLYRELQFSDISEAVEYYYDHKASSNRMKQKSSDLIKALESNIDKLRLKKQRLSEDLLQAENADIFRLFGELITANIYRIGDKQSEIDVENYYTGERLNIQLDPRLSASRNAQRYYKKYTKSKTAIIEKNSQLDETNKDIAYLESVLVHLENATTFDEIEEIRQELIEIGYLKKRSTSTKNSKLKPLPLSRLSSDGFRILVGRNNRENDLLTFKIASPKDIWLHTKDIPGSHVIVVTDGRQVPEKTLFEAASIAAFYSKGRLSENVPVDYTLVKHVKKPAGAKPGMVIFVNNKTIYVTPSDLQHYK